MTAAIRQSAVPSRAPLVAEADALLRRLFPICRSLTGEGVRRTIAELQRVVPFAMHEVPSGEAVYDWVVPDEWNIRDAWVKDDAGRRVIDFRQSNLHVVNYSEPVDRVMSFAELRPHLHTLPQFRDTIPYRTSYYKRTWGFCLTHAALEDLAALGATRRYHVKIDATLAPGSLTYADLVMGGNAPVAAGARRNYLVSTYCCHPSLANDNLSGVVLTTLLARELAGRRLRHTYHFVVIPETIGAIAYLARNEQAMKRIDGGFVITTVAGPGPFGYKQTFRGDDVIDRVVRETFAERGIDYIAYPFDINGSDERQYSQPTFRIPVGTICKDKYFEYDAYHTSRDNLDYISADNLVATLELYLSAIDKLERPDSHLSPWERSPTKSAGEGSPAIAPVPGCGVCAHNDTARLTLPQPLPEREGGRSVAYRSLCPSCEPMLGKRGLYPTLGGAIHQPASSQGTAHEARDYSTAARQAMTGRRLDAIRWLMFWSDGNHTLVDIAAKTDISVDELQAMATLLCEHRLLKKPDLSEGPDQLPQSSAKCS